MDFHNRQYDPQLGRFLSIDPLAMVTPTVSPYAAMDNNPVSMVDPLGLQPGEPNWLQALFNRPSFSAWRGDSPLNVLDRWQQFRSPNAPGGIDYAAEEAALKAYFAQARAEAEKQNLAQGNSSKTQGTSQITGNMTDGFTIEGTTVQGKSKGFFGKLWGGVKSAWSSVQSIFTDYEFIGEVIYSVGVQAGVGVETPVGGLGVELNAFSIDLGSAKDIINGKDDATTDYIGKGYWMNIRQEASVDFIVGGASIDREMRSPTGGGGFFDKKVTEETKTFGTFNKKEYYQDGLQTQSFPKTPTYTEGLKFGFNIQFLFGAKIDFEIRRK
jgi:hypothetical protein